LALLPLLGVPPQQENRPRPHHLSHRSHEKSGFDFGYFLGNEYQETMFQYMVKSQVEEGHPN
jgi:hypothetical protein